VHINFEYHAEIIHYGRGRIYDRGYLLDLLNAYGPEIPDGDSESCDETSSSGRESALARSAVFPQDGCFANSDMTHQVGVTQ
jgi:hypothetical protein